MDILSAAILAVVQGITEWLPVSSSAHLVLFQNLLNAEASVFFDVMLHFGTLLAVLVYFRKRILELIRAFITFKFKTRDEKLTLYIILASIPTAIIGFAFKDFFESLFSSLSAVAVALIITGIVLYLTQLAKPKKKMGPFEALIIGVAQGIAIIPGISRSGTTISTGMFLGLKKKEAAEFSFLLSIPAILGASIFQAKDAMFSFSPEIILGVAVAAIVGYLSIGILMKVLEEGKFHWFGYYCLALGALILALRL